MLPAEITTIAGSGFDVDKLYILLPEFNVRKIYNLKSAWDDCNSFVTILKYFFKIGMYKS